MQPLQPSPMQRVLIIGISGAGKSTFARELAARTGLPLIHLDREFWRPGWVMTPVPEWRERVSTLSAGDTWIMEGNYSGTMDIRLPRADTVVWFDYPRRVALPRIAKRVVKNYGTVRSDMGPGCPEQLDWEFVRWVWNFPAKSRPLIVAALKQNGGHLEPHLVRRDKDVCALLARLAPTAEPR
jgi:adenylate kinase family enzyme